MCSYAVRFLGVGAEDPSNDESIFSSLFLVQEYLAGGNLKRIVLEQILDPSVSA